MHILGKQGFKTILFNKHFEKTNTFQNNLLLKGPPKTPPF